MYICLMYNHNHTVEEAFASAIDANVPDGLSGLVDDNALVVDVVDSFMNDHESELLEKDLEESEIQGGC